MKQLFLLILTLVLVVAGIKVMMESFDSDSSESTELTIQKFSNIQNGMTYDQVVEILGPGTEDSTYIVPADMEKKPVTFKIMQWQNTDGSYMNITFQNDTVQSKAQSGL